MSLRYTEGAQGMSGWEKESKKSTYEELTAATAVILVHSHHVSKASQSTMLHPFNHSTIHSFSPAHLGIPAATS